MKNCKKTVAVLLSLLLIAVAVLPAAANETNNIPEVFTEDLFSDEIANKLLGMIPAVCTEFESAFLQATSVPIIFEDNITSMINIEMRHFFFVNGADGSQTLHAFFAENGANIYPQTLGAYLQQNGFSAIGETLAAYSDWEAFFAANGAQSFSFDWGIDALTGAERYNRFLTAAAAILGSNRPVFDALFGKSNAVFQYGETPVFCVRTECDIEIEFMFIHAEAHNLYRTVTEDGSLTILADNLYDRVVVPVYKALGLSVVIPYTFTGVSPSDSNAAFAEKLFAPLYMLTQENDPETLAELAVYYPSDMSASFLASAAVDKLTLHFYTNDVAVQLLESSGVTQAVASVYDEEHVWNLVHDNIRELTNSDFEIADPAAAWVAEIKEAASGLLPALTYTAPGTPTEPETPTQPETPTEPDTPAEPGTNSDSDANSIWQALLNLLNRFTGFFRSIFERLLALLGIGTV